jgi:hypothetical protein
MGLILVSIPTGIPFDDPWVPALVTRPTCRATRTARTTVLKDENANANPHSRIVTRSKPPSTSNHTTQPSIPTHLTAPTLSTRANPLTKDAQLEDPAQGKHKCPTLGEVTVNKPKGCGVVTEMGKAKEDAAQVMPAPPSKSAGVVMRNKSAATMVIPQSRQVLLLVAAPVPHPALPSRWATRSSVSDACSPEQVCWCGHEEQVCHHDGNTSVLSGPLLGSPHLSRILPFPLDGPPIHLLAMPAPPSKSAGVVMKNKSAATTAIPQSHQVLRSVAHTCPASCPSL